MSKAVEAERKAEQSPPPTGEKRPEEGSPPEKPARREKARSWLQEHPFALPVIIVFLVLAAGAAFWAWSYYSVRESTDDARVDGHVSPVSARVSGHVLEILVEENDRVTAGQVLARIDDRDYKIAVERAQADLAAQSATAAAARTQIPVATTTSSSSISAAQGGLLEAQAGVSAANRNIENAQARVAAAEAGLRAAAANRDRAAKDLERYRQLVAKDEIPRQQFDAAATALQAAQAEVDNSQSAIAQAKAGVQVAQSEQQRAQARVAEARSRVAAAQTGPQQIEASRAQANSQAAAADVKQAALNQALLNLEYTVIRSPVAGIVGRRNVQTGQNVQPGQPLFSVVQVSDLWVTALFKETQLDQMHAGQRAIVEIDAFDGTGMKGHVDSIGAATGGTFSVLPPENASGNYVKVVQRVPVKIVFEPNQPLLNRLRPGMSVVPTVLLK